MFDLMRLLIPAQWHAVPEDGGIVMRRRHEGRTERREPTEAEISDVLWAQAIR